MKIISIKRGHATNSSSAHTIIWTESPDKIKNQPRYTKYGYHWEWFALKTPQAKAEYLISQVLIGLVAVNFPWDINNWEQFIKPYQDFLSPKFKERVSDWEKAKRFERRISIDHQSQWSVALYQNGQIAADFYEQLFLSIITNPSYVIRGGNDNVSFKKEAEMNTCVDKDVYKIFPTLAKFGFFQDLGMAYYLVRDQGDAWALFDRYYGTLVLIKKDKPTKQSYVPELLDIKVTDICYQNCSFCYQNSSPEGKIAERYTITEFFSELSKADMLPFEVAIGGGEPLTYGYLETIIQYLRDIKINVNLSTRVHAILTYPVLFDGLLKLGLSNIGVSVDSASQLQKLLLGNYFNNLTIHYIPELHSPKMLKQILNICETHYVPILLLGYKPIGRGVNITPKNKITDIENVLLSYKGKINLAVDTVMASKLDMDKLKVSPIYYSLEEGKRSKYVDFVTKSIGKTSYDGKTIPYNKKNLKKLLRE